MQSLRRICPFFFCHAWSANNGLGNLGKGVGRTIVTFMSSELEFFGPNPVSHIQITRRWIVIVIHTTTIIIITLAHFLKSKVIYFLDVFCAHLNVLMLDPKPFFMHAPLNHFPFKVTTFMIVYLAFYILLHPKSEQQYLKTEELSKCFHQYIYRIRMKMLLWHAINDNAEEEKWNNGNCCCHYYIIESNCFMFWLLGGWLSKSKWLSIVSQQRL